VNGLKNLLQLSHQSQNQNDKVKQKIVTINLVHIYKIQNQNKLNYGY